MVSWYDALEHFCKILMVISSIPEAFLTSLLDFGGSTFRTCFSIWSFCKFFLYFNHTQCHSEKNILKTPKLFYCMTCGWLKAFKFVEQNPHKGTKINLEWVSGDWKLQSPCRCQNILVLLSPSRWNYKCTFSCHTGNDIRMRTLWTCTWPMFSALRSTRHMPMIQAKQALGLGCELWN